MTAPPSATALVSRIGCVLPATAAGAASCKAHASKWRYTAFATATDAAIAASHCERTSCTAARGLDVRLLTRSRRSSTACSSCLAQTTSCCTRRAATARLACARDGDRQSWGAAADAAAWPVRVRAKRICLSGAAVQCRVKMPGRVNCSIYVV
eukprot:scaffold30547_cov63-Phaeocystis_antarctica.AAC.2